MARIKMIESSNAALRSMFLISGATDDFDGRTLEEVLDGRFPMGEVSIRAIGPGKYEILIEGERIRPIDIHWFERTIGPIADFYVNNKENH